MSDLLNNGVYKMDAKNYSPYAGFWIRVLAYLIDVVIISFATFFIKGFWLSLLVLCLYFIIMESSVLQASVGKLLFRIAVVDSLSGEKISFAKAFNRNIFKYILGLILSPVIAFKKDKQGFHDTMAGTFVVKKKSLPSIKDFIGKGKKAGKRGYAICLIFVLFLALIGIFKESVIGWYKIPAGSMIPTLKVGDHLFVNKLAYGLHFPLIGEVKKLAEPQRGDIVVFTHPLAGGKPYIKRLIGIPGDKIRIADDKLYINDKLIQRVETEFYPTMNDVTDKQQYTPQEYSLSIEDLEGKKHFVLQLKDRSKLYHQFSTEVVVPEGSLFFMGDNRDNSEDSRVWGFVPREAVQGKATSIWFPFKKFGEKVK
jgi:signal peptidase I